MQLLGVGDAKVCMEIQMWTDEVWDNYHEGKVTIHIMVSEDGKERGTMETEVSCLPRAKEKGWEKASFDQKCDKFLS